MVMFIVIGTIKTFNGPGCEMIHKGLERDFFSSGYGIEPLL